MDNVEKEELDYKDFTNQLNLIDNNNKTNLLDQLPSYNFNENSLFINNLKTELDQQKTLNMILENKDLNTNINNIKKFTKENSSKINNQLNEIKTVSKSLQDIIIKNNQLKEEHQELIEIENGPEYNEIANNMKELKRQKENIKNFLEKMGIISPPLIL